jgi:hypothetical protein
MTGVPGLVPERSPDEGSARPRARPLMPRMTAFGPTTRRPAPLDPAGVTPPWHLRGERGGRPVSKLRPRPELL